LKVVEFQNTQGVEVQYICADLSERILAFIIDFAIMFFSVIIVSMMVSSASTLVQNVVQLLLLIPLIFFYNLLFELFNDGQSFGKMIIGTKVVRVDGMPLQTNDLLIRWLFRMVDFAITSGVLAAVFCGVTPRSQRLGDLLADTTVIKVKQRKTGLKRVLSLTKLSQHKPKYLKQALFTEDQMLLIKEVHDRVANYPSPANRELQANLANTIAASIGIKTPKNHKLFLTQVVKDYVAITR
jgi:uncharacterized RDD family membrane protein YckC